MIDIAKYTTRDRSVLTDEEILMESKLPKVKFSLDIYEEDMELIKKYKLVASRIFRLKIHEWLQEKIVGDNLGNTTL
jgi:hypothetical protein